MVTEFQIFGLFLGLGIICSILLRRHALILTLTGAFALFGANFSESALENGLLPAAAQMPLSAAFPGVFCGIALFGLVLILKHFPAACEAWRAREL